ncbi:TonB-dependent receptor domain-containing protein [Erythrobacter sp. THAF29]|uniref:TonB-dependent receptor domain-containing protein n=1 Tax=Erythrobacter sp. THAF29 TaxID=2587851 RepID=UPI001268C7B1|nr:TonB-dependent receptor [Erythrobacter sp. THAF29]QFT77005.1 Vitamin B12 transporter BtuB precursor [Erythrobacter sp. THAF29]
MKKFHSNSVKALAFSASAIAFVMAGPVSAQDEGEEGQEQAEEDEEQVDVGTDASGQTNQGGGITVTGSRIVRDTYSSISPLQVLSTENQQAVGAFDPAQILQRSESAAGQQIDATFQGFVLDNGPGSQTLNLRGLGADRTLLLLNGRRLAPAGVEGAPTNPSLNLIPSTLVDRYDLLLDGASSVYGSDAVAGVGNLILRKDFDGLELQANGNINPGGAGEDYVVSGAWGFNTDRAFFGIGAEYAFRDEVTLGDRDFLSGCDTHYEVDQNGNILTIDLSDNAAIQEDSGTGIRIAEDECKVSGISGRVFNPFTRLGSFYFPTNGNIANIPGLNFGENTNLNGLDVDLNGDGIRDVDFRNVNNNAANLDRTFISQQKLINVFAYGEYTFPGEANITPYFEANYSRAEISLPNTGTPQVFPSVPGSNAFNPCNPNAAGGADCREADNNFQLASDPDIFTRDLDGDGDPDVSPLSFGFPFGLPTTPIFTIRGDRNNVEVIQEQYRGVLGVRGDLPFIGSSWTFDFSGVFSRSEGSSTRDGIREDRLALAIGIDPTADFDGDGVFDNDGDGIADDYDNNVDFFTAPIGVCDTSALANPGAAAPDLAQGCVPVNLFSPSVLGATIGDFESQAERDYLFDQRSFDTTYEQIILSGFITGDLFELPAGPVGVVIGAEYREDTIDSSPNFQASNGLFFGFFADGGATGSRSVAEAFGEIDIPLIAGETLVEELTVNLSGRLTDDEFYGTNGTYSIKGGWRPVAPLLLKFSYGTSFRAPNLRELFLRNQSGFLTLFDPCAVPDAAFVGGQYNAATDERDQFVLDNCIREGRDPTTAGIDDQGLNTFQTNSVELTSGGVVPLGAPLDPETSRSITTGFAFEESFASGFDFALNFNYYDIELKNSIIEPSGQFIINDCYNRDDGVRSQFCDRIGVSSQGRMLVSDVFQGFLNLDQENVRGIDINASFGYPVMIGSSEFDLGLNIRANHLIERSSLFTNDDGSIAFDDDAGEFGFPSWTGRATFTVDYDDFRFTWQTRYIGDVEQQADGIDPLSDAFGNGPDGNPTGFTGDTCLGGGTPGFLVPGATGSGAIAGTGIFCRDVGFADEWFEHTASIRWDNGTIRIIAGVTNIFDTDPPLIDTNEVFGISNTPIGNGYNLDGREFFGQLLYRF